MEDYLFAPLHIASQNGCVEIIKMLIEAGADLEKKDRLIFI